MNDYVFTEFDVLQLNNNATTCTKNPTLSTNYSEVRTPNHYSSLQVAMDDRFETQTNFAIDAGLKYLDYSSWNSDIQAGSTDRTNHSSSTSEEMGSTNGDMLEELEPYMPAASYELLKELEETKLNLILVATSLDENSVIQKLESSLDAKTCRMIPLTFKDDQINDVDVSKLLDSIMPEEPKLESASTTKETENRINEYLENSREMPVKPKQPGKDEKYWKRRNKNNEAAKRSREAKRARLVWIEARTKELEVENARLDEQLKTLQSKASELEKRA